MQSDKVTSQEVERLGISARRLIQAARYCAREGQPKKALEYSSKARQVAADFDTALTSYLYEI